MKILLILQSFFVNLIKTKISAVRILLQSNFFGFVSSDLKSKPLLILGNGPSLNDTLSNNCLETLNHFDMMAVNNAANHVKYVELKPRYYLLNADTYFLPDKSLNDLYIRMNRELFESLKVKTTWKITLLVPFRAKKSSALRDLIQSNSYIDLAFFNKTPVEGFHFWSHRWFNKGLGMPRPHNVLIPGIMMGIRLGYKIISIVGADHSWLAEISVNKANEVFVHQKHFYDENESKPEKMQDYIHRSRRLHEIIHKFYLSFKGYWEIKSFAEKKGVKIYNSSEISMIDAFERVEIESIKT
jgi:hypothetical protein